MMLGSAIHFDPIELVSAQKRYNLSYTPASYARGSSGNFLPFIRENYRFLIDYINLTQKPIASCVCLLSIDMHVEHSFQQLGSLVAAV